MRVSLMVPIAAAVLAAGCSSSHNSLPAESPGPIPFASRSTPGALSPVPSTSPTFGSPSQPRCAPSSLRFGPATSGEGDGGEFTVYVETTYVGSTTCVLSNDLTVIGYEGSRQIFRLDQQIDGAFTTPAHPAVLAPGLGARIAIGSPNTTAPNFHPCVDYNRIQIGATGGSLTDLPVTSPGGYTITWCTTGGTLGMYLTPL